MFLPNLVPTHSADGETFYWIHENFDLLVVLDEKSGDHLIYYNLSSGDHECLKIQDLRLYYAICSGTNVQGHWNSCVELSVRDINIRIYTDVCTKFHRNQSHGC